MSNRLEFDGTLDSHLDVIAGRLAAALAERPDLTNKELAKECSEIAESLGLPPLRSDRISKILKPSRKGWVWVREIKLLCMALNIGVQWLEGKDSRDPIIFWDALSDRHRAGHVLHLLRTYQEAARIFRAWAEFFPCSLIPPDFMHAEHAARLLDDVAESPDGDAAVRMYDEIGNQRRIQLESKGFHRGYAFHHLMLLSDLEKVIYGHPPYHQVAASLRRGCFAGLQKFISDPRWKIKLFIAKDDAVQAIRKYFEFDSVIVIDESFSQARDHRGGLAWSTNPERVRFAKNLLEDFETRAAYSEPHQVLNLLERAKVSVR